ncbi:lactonase family protein [Marinomonas rhizomae]|uniref:lactonase family protein n=1 Tax=Marinomonas rhizomae TaxID=491948 RepID=UPI0021054318|nr:lactonase family protein [Marinomonas rhizomae]UTV98420.1 lactonase family protein [Marinomonas rhizomae]
MLAFIGCRTTKERNARGEGISLVSYNEIDGSLKLVHLEKGLTNPSYLVINKAGDRLYIVHGDGSEVSVFKFDANSRKLTHLNTQDTGGLNPVHLALSQNEKHLVVSNHITSSLAVLPINAEGGLLERSHLIQLAGEPGPHRKEQPFSKPHFNPFDPSGRFVVVPDKGLDKIFLYEFKNGQLDSTHLTEVDCRETSGPRNLVFHTTKPWAYVVNELDSTITAYEFDNKTGALVPFQILSGLSDRFTGNSRASGITLDMMGKTLYSSHRGADAIAVMKIDSETGSLTLIQTISGQGKTPRFITLSPDGKWLYALNEDSDNIITFAVMPETGLLQETSQCFITGSPVCMVFN